MKNGILITIFGLIETFTSPTDEIIEPVSDNENKENSTQEK